MRTRDRFSISLAAVLAAFVPYGTTAAQAPVAQAGLSVTAGTGPDTVRVSGTFAGAHQLQAVLYATFAPELPRVLLSRRPLATDADGHFDATMQLAPAYFTGAIITVIVQTSAAVPLGMGSFSISDPTDRPPPSH